MVRILLNGCNGAMGKVIAQCVEKYDDCKIVCGVDKNTEQFSDFPVYDSADKFLGEVDAIIDFSHPSALSGILKYSTEKNVPIVVATTGLTKSQNEEIIKASEKVAVFFSANMSLGVNLISELSKKAAQILGQNFDIEIVEMHHNQKIDAPSGTALMLADSISEAFESEPKYEFDRHSKRSKRTKDEIGIHSVRGGTIVGEHEVIFAGNDEIIKISHTATSKQIFANGAINAAKFISSCSPGMYSMKELINN